MDADGVLEGMQPYEIHGTRYYRVFYSQEAGGEILACQLPFDAIDASLRPGDPIVLTYLMKSVMRVERKADRGRPTTEIPRSSE